MQRTTLAVVLDTDIGTNVDDALALAMLLGSPEVALIGCTTVYGDTALRGRIARRVARLAGRADITVVPGAATALDGRPPEWAGHEGSGLDDLHRETVDDSVDAATWLARTVLAAPGTIDVVAIGPLTNVALALRMDPRVAPAIRSITVMGGRFDAPRAERNMRSDPAAAAVVFRAGVPLTVTGLDVTTRVRLEAADLTGVASAGPLGSLLRDQVARYLRLLGRPWTTPHDPVAALTLLRPDLFTMTEAHVAVDAGGVCRLTPAADGPVRVTTGVDAEQALAEVLRRVTRAAAAR